MRGRDLGDRGGQDRDVISAGVRPGITRAQLGGQQFGGVITPHPDWVKPKAALECWRRVLFLAVSHHDRCVDIEHHHVTQIGIGDPRCRQPLRKRRPHVAAYPRAGGVDLGQPWRAIDPG